MKKFLFFLFQLILIGLVSAIFLDFFYSKMYLQSDKRGKVGYAYNSKPKIIDVAILGSSRAYYHFATPMFEDKGLKTFNYGMEGSKLFEADLMLKLLLEKKNKIKNVILDVDLTLSSNSQDYSEANILKFMPYFWSSKTIRKQFEDLPHYNMICYFPFYRYMKYDAKLGFREMFMNAINKKSYDQDNGGYYGLSNSNNKLEMNLSGYYPKKNKYYEEIKKICKKNNINLIAVMTPICKNTRGLNNLNKINKIYPEIYNYENVVVEDKYFSSCGHMNDEGARMFTARILKDFFKK